MARNTKEEFLRKFNNGKCYSVCFVDSEGYMVFIKDIVTVDEWPFTINFAEAAHFTENYAKAIMTLLDLSYPEYAPYEIVEYEMTVSFI